MEHALIPRIWSGSLSGSYILEQMEYASTTTSKQSVKKNMI